MENNQNEEILTEQDFEKMKNLGLSDEELDNIKNALALTELAESVPQDTDAFIQKMNNYFPDDPEQALIKYFELAKTDPEFFKEIVCFQEFLGTYDEPIETTSIADALRQIRVESNPEEKAKMAHTLLISLGTAKEDKKQDYEAEIKNLLTLDEKKELFDILKNKK